MQRVYCAGVWMHMLAKLCLWIVVACRRLVKAGGFISCIYDMCVLTWFALWVHSVGMWSRMIATLGEWIVVACLWLVKAGCLMC